MLARDARTLVPFALALIFAALAPGVAEARGTTVKVMEDGTGWQHEARYDQIFVNPDNTLSVDLGLDGIRAICHGTVEYSDNPSWVPGIRDAYYNSQRIPVDRSAAVYRDNNSSGDRNNFKPGHDTRCSTAKAPSKPNGIPLVVHDYRSIQSVFVPAYVVILKNGDTYLFDVGQKLTIDKNNLASIAVPTGSGTTTINLGSVFASKVISNDGGSVLSKLITNDGGTVISNDGGSVISNDGGSIINQDGASLAAQIRAAAALVGNSGGTFSTTFASVINGTGAGLASSGTSSLAPVGGVSLAAGGTTSLVTDNGSGIAVNNGANFTLPRTMGYSGTVEPAPSPSQQPALDDNQKHMQAAFGTMTTLCGTQSPRTVVRANMSAKEYIRPGDPRYPYTAPTGDNYWNAYTCLAQLNSTYTDKTQATGQPTSTTASAPAANRIDSVNAIGTGAFIVDATHHGYTFSSTDVQNVRAQPMSDGTVRFTFQIGNSGALVVAYESADKQTMMSPSVNGSVIVATGFGSISKGMTFQGNTFTLPDGTKQTRGNVVGPDGKISLSSNDGSVFAGLERLAATPSVPATAAKPVALAYPKTISDIGMGDLGKNSDTFLEDGNAAAWQFGNGQATYTPGSIAKTGFSFDLTHGAHTKFTLAAGSGGKYRIISPKGTEIIGAGRGRMPGDPYFDNKASGGEITLDELAALLGPPAPAVASSPAAPAQTTSGSTPQAKLVLAGTCPGAGDVVLTIDSPQQTCSFASSKVTSVTAGTAPASYVIATPDGQFTISAAAPGLYVSNGKFTMCANPPSTKAASPCTMLPTALQAFVKQPAATTASTNPSPPRTGAGSFTQDSKIVIGSSAVDPQTGNLNSPGGGGPATQTTSPSMPQAKLVLAGTCPGAGDIVLSIDSPQQTCSFTSSKVTSVTAGTAPASYVIATPDGQFTISAAAPGLYVSNGKFTMCANPPSTKAASPCTTLPSALQAFVKQPAVTTASTNASPPRTGAGSFTQDSKIVIASSAVDPQTGNLYAAGGGGAPAGTTVSTTALPPSPSTTTFHALSMTPSPQPPTNSSPSVTTASSGNSQNISFAADSKAVVSSNNAKEARKCAASDPPVALFGNASDLYEFVDMTVWTKTKNGKSLSEATEVRCLGAMRQAHPNVKPASNPRSRAGE